MIEGLAVIIDEDDFVSRLGTYINNISNYELKHKA